MRRATNVDGVPVTAPGEVERLIAGKSGLNRVSFYTDRKQPE